MMRLARKAGMVIVTEAGEANARLELRPAGMTTITREMMADRVALLDYAMKAQLTAARRLAASWRGEAEKASGTSSARRESRVRASRPRPAGAAAGVSFFSRLIHFTMMKMIQARMMK